LTVYERHRKNGCWTHSSNWSFQGQSEKS